MKKVIIAVILCISWELNAQVALPTFQAVQYAGEPPLYSFSSHTFTNCGKTGRYGPTLAECKSSYNTSWEGNTDFFNVQTQGVQEWTVPSSGTYTIEAWGARGGEPYTLHSDASYLHRGEGVKIRGTFTLTSGDVIKIAVGQEGTKNTNGNYANGGGGGGGGYFVWKNTSALIIAGGGGGQGIQNHDYAKGQASDGSLTESGTMGPNATESNYGTNGGDATGDGGSSRWAKGWNSIISNLSKLDGLSTSHAGFSGFGGGGVSSHHAGGGGGGYSGGGVQDYGSPYSGSGSTNTIGGGGGGSYFSSGGSGRVDSSTLGYNAGQGKVIIIKI